MNFIKEWILPLIKGIGMFLALCAGAVFGFIVLAVIVRVLLGGGS